jgi:uncharacterized protein (DUF488 family)
LNQTLYTAGHSTRPLAEFIELLRAAGVTLLADVRAYPASRRHPHFSREPLAESLKAQGIAYKWLGRELGGHRQPRQDSPNTALGAAWRGYADHMATPLYKAGLAELELQAQTQTVCVMCAERNPCDCHRSFIADSLMNRKWCVTHLIGANEKANHALNPTAQANDSGLRYPGTDQVQMQLGF